MADIDPQAATLMLDGLLQPWHAAVEDPANAQQEVLHRLLKDYAQTDYGAQHGASQIEPWTITAALFPSPPTKTTNRSLSASWLAR